MCPVCIALVVWLVLQVTAMWLWRKRFVILLFLIIVGITVVVTLCSKQPSCGKDYSNVCVFDSVVDKVPLGAAGTDRH